MLTCILERNHRQFLDDFNWIWSCGFFSLRKSISWIHMCAWVTLSLGTHTTLAIQSFSCLYDHGVFTPIDLLNQGYPETQLTSSIFRNSLAFQIPEVSSATEKHFSWYLQTHICAIAYGHFSDDAWLFSISSRPDDDCASYHCHMMAVQLLITAIRWLFSILSLPDDDCSASYHCHMMAVQHLITAIWWLFSFLSLPGNGCTVLITAWWRLFSAYHCLIMAVHYLTTAW